MYNPSKPYKHKLLTQIKSTWDTPYVKVRSGVYPIITKKFSGLEVVHTDGIGTKGVYHWRKRTFKNAVIDALAMNLNDLALVGARPYAITDHLTIPGSSDTPVLVIMKELVSLCRKYDIAIVGGETSHHDTVDSLDISISMSGVIEKERKNRFKTGDILIGLKSNGLHSNGFTRVRKIFTRDEWRADFVRPTAIYLNTVLPLLKKYEIHGMMHITGGAFTKLKDILHGADAVIAQPKALFPQSIFAELYARGVSDKDMYTTFNCGIGFVLAVSLKDAMKVAHTAQGAIIGKVVRGSGRVRITSAFSGKELLL